MSEQEIRHNGTAAADVLPRAQYRTTEFLFDVFDRTWAGRGDVQVSLLKAAVFPDKTDRTIARYVPYIMATAVLQDLVMDGHGICDAADVVFHSVGPHDPREMIAGILIHSGETPIAHIGNAVGMPLWTNGGDIVIAWDNDRHKIFRM